MLKSTLLRRLGFLSGPLLTAGCIPAGQNASVEAVGAPGTRFPRVVGIKLEGKQLSLPDDFGGNHNLVAVAFEQDQQELVDTWIDVGDELIADIPGFRFMVDSISSERPHV